MAEILTPADLELIRSYLAELDDIAQREPPRLTSEEWDEVWPQLQKGEIPAEYQGRITKSFVQDHFTGDKPQPAYSDTVWEKWNAERVQIDKKYRSVVLKAIQYAFSQEQPTEGNQPLRELLQAILDKGTLSADEVRELLPQLASIIPQKHLIPNNKLANSLTKDIIDAGTIALDVGKKKGDITTRCILSYEGDNVKLSSRQPFTEYDRQVADAVTSLYEYGDESHVITAATVYRAMVHATDTETPSPQQIGAVTRSLDKMRFVRVQIDCSEELTRRKLSLNGAQITGGKIDTYLLALDKLEVIAGGQRVAAYKVIKTPLLYDYSRLTGQVLTVPAALLDIRDKTGAKVANTDRRIAIKGYLMRRISIMQGKTGSEKSRHIKYDTVYTEVCEGKELSRRDQQLIREYIAAVLDDWTRNGFIKGYKETQEGRKKTGIEIKI